MMKRLIAILILTSYSALLVKVMVFKELPLIRIGSLKLNLGGTQKGDANFLPFSTILPYLLGERGLMIGAINIIGNIVLLIPIGFLFPFVSRNMTWRKSLILAVTAGFAIEGLQVILRVGIFDIDDVILNGLGVMIGYWTFTLLINTFRSKKCKDLTTTPVNVQTNQYV
jgi:glycopeptide antibiotics resistance protein